MSNIPVSYFTDFNAMSEGVRRRNLASLKIQTVEL